MIRLLIIGIGSFVVLLVVFGVTVEVVKDIKYSVTKRRRFIQTFVTQDDVNESIQEWAHELKSLFDEQVKYYQVAMEDASVADHEAAQSRMQCAVDSKKAMFWERVKLARDNGFKVPSTVDKALALRPREN